MTDQAPTGCIKNPERLRAVQDAIWNSGKYMPKDTDGNEVTYCNLAVLAVLRAFGFSNWEGFTADQMMEVMQESRKDSTSLWIPKPITDCQDLVNQGTIIVAGLSSKQLQQSHGHVCTLTPGEEDYSGHWNAKTPVCLSIGRKAICFRSRGVNWAFVPEPEFYAWVPSL